MRHQLRDPDWLGPRRSDIALGRAGRLARALPLYPQYLEVGRGAGEWFATRYTMAHLAVIFARANHLRSAASLSTVVDSALFAAIDRSLFEPAMDQTRSVLGAVEFDRLAEEGAAMSFVDLVRETETGVQALLTKITSTGDTASIGT